MTWLAPLATFLPAAACLAGAAGLFAMGDREVWALALLAAFPLALGTGYLLVGLPWRGLAVVIGGFAALLVVGFLLFTVPTDFEDAGTLISIVSGVLLLALLGYAGWAGWDVRRQAAAGASAATPVGAPPP